MIWTRDYELPGGHTAHVAQGSNGAVIVLVNRRNRSGRKWTRVATRMFDGAADAFEWLITNYGTVMVSREAKAA